MFDQYRSILAELVNRNPLLGLALTHHQNTRGQPLSFKDKPYLIELYADLYKQENAVIRKAVQTGVSELCIQMALERAGFSGRIVAYVLPTYSIRDRFVQKRIDPLLQHVPAYRARCPGGEQFGGPRRGKSAAGNLKMKQFGDGTMMFLGSNTPGDFIEFSADVLIIDEFDQCDPGNLAKARDRLRASPYPQEVRLGNPSLPRIGISRLFDESDGRRWFFKCDRCGEMQPLDWFINVVQQDDEVGWAPRDAERWKWLKAANVESAGQSNDLRPVCRRCHRPFERQVAGALWVPERPEIAVRGYTMSRLDVLSDTLWALYKEWLGAQGNTERMTAFYTGVLGVPFEFSGSRLTHTLLADAATGDALDYLGGDDYAKRVVTAGIDVGAVLNVSISTVEALPPDAPPDEEPVRQARWIGAVRTFEEVAELLHSYHVDIAVIDAQPETRKAQELRDYFANAGGAVVWLCRFHPTQRVGVQKYGMRLDYQAQVVNVDRTAVFDATFDDIQHGRRIFPEDIFTVLGWADQMRAPVRVLDESKGKIVWTSGSTPDHYRLAGIYDRVAYDLLAMGGSYSAV